MAPSGHAARARSMARACRASTYALMMSSDLPDSLARNIEQWTKNNQDALDARAPQGWARTSVTWGVFGSREEDLGSPLGEVRGRDVVELGCGTAYQSAILAKLGA